MTWLNTMLLRASSCTPMNSEDDCQPGPSGTNNQYLDNTLMDVDRAVPVQKDDPSLLSITPSLHNMSLIDLLLDADKTRKTSSSNAIADSWTTSGQTPGFLVVSPSEPSMGQENSLAVSPQIRTTASSPIPSNLDLTASYWPTVDQYRLMQTIGQGSFAKVKIGQHIRTGQLVAVKIINKTKLKLDIDQLKRIERETRLIAQLRHPHVIGFIKNITSPTDMFLIVELAGGGELFDYIVTRGRLPETQARSFFQQLVSGVRCCHELGIVHRDLKPENILLDAQHRNVKIADFGLASALLDGQLLLTACGSPNYAAPEIVQHNFYAGPEVDIWSLGVILYVMITGQLPFASTELATLFRQILSGTFPIPPEMSEEVSHLCQRMICVDPIQRATLDELMLVINNNTWLSTDCPNYLFGNTDKSYKDKEKDIPVNMDTVCQFALTHNKPLNQVLIELAAGQHPELILGYSQPSTSRRSSENAERNIDRSNLRLISAKHADRKRQLASLPNSLIAKASAQEELCYTEPVQPVLIKPSIRVCIPEGSQFCRPDCDLCPTWGAQRCLFVHRVRKLNQCDLCSHYKGKGCMFSLDKITMEDLCLPRTSEKTSFRIGDKLSPGSGSSGSSSKEEILDSKMSSVFSPTVDESLRKMLAERSCTRENWHLGVTSGSTPALIMTAICKTLKKTDFEWKRIDTYHLVVKPVGKEQPLFEVRLYRVKQNTYLLDFTHQVVINNDVSSDVPLANEQRSTMESGPVDLDDPMQDHVGRLYSSQYAAPSTSVIYLDQCSKILGRILK